MEDASHVFGARTSVELAGNVDTGFAPAHVLEPRKRYEGELFFEHYEAIREWVGHHRHPGLAIVALSDDGVQAKAYLRASARAVNTAIVGRYDRAEISLRDDPSISLRHLAVIVAPYRGNGQPRFRLVDLRTAAGFTSSSGQCLRACDADEAFFIRCGRYSVLFAPSAGETSRWPEEPEEGWSAIRRGCTETFALRHPSTLDECLLSDDEEALGELVITSEDGMGTMLVGRIAARSGVLLGRSDRCDGDVLLGDPHISRVHLLIVEIAGRLYAIDTASKNGVWGRCGGHRSRLLESGSRLSLCGLATVEWRFLH